MKISDMIIVSDMDGTIIPRSGVISQKNIDAIKKFRSLGGTFTVATGRSPYSGSSFFEILSIQGAIIANNGATIYDVATGQTLWCEYLSDYKKVVRYVQDNFIEIAIELITDDNEHYVVSHGKIDDTFVRGSDFKYHHVNEEDYPDNCCKVLFVSPISILSYFVENMRNQNFSEFQLVESGGGCFEMMASGVTKGYPFERLLNIYNKDIKNSAAIGDYYNDVEMLEKAAIGAAVGDAVEPVKQAANVIVRNCEDDGVADFIEYLINNYN